MEDVHRAGGIMAILGELDRAGLIHRDCPTVLYPTLGEQLDCCDVKRTDSKPVHDFRAARAGADAGRLAEPPFPEARPRPRKRLHPRPGACLFAGRRPGRASTATSQKRAAS